MSDQQGAEIDLNQGDWLGALGLLTLLGSPYLIYKAWKDYEQMRKTWRQYSDLEKYKNGEKQPIKCLSDLENESSNLMMFQGQIKPLETLGDKKALIKRNYYFEPGFNCSL